VTAESMPVHGTLTSDGLCALPDTALVFLSPVLSSVLAWTTQLQVIDLLNYLEALRDVVE